MTAPTGMLRIQRPGHRAPKGFRSLPHPQRYTAAPGDFVGGGLRSWLAVRCTRTAAHRPPGTHSLRSRHSGAAASTPASLPSLTVPRGYASVGRLAGSGASPLSVHGLFRNGPLDTGLTPLPSCGCSALYRGPKAQRGVPRSGLWSEEWESPRSGVRYASGTGSERAKVASVAERNPPRAFGPSVAGSLFRNGPPDAGLPPRRQGSPGHWRSSPRRGAP